MTTPVYCTPEDVTRFYRPGTFQTAADLKADSGASQTYKDRVYLVAASASAYVAGDRVRVYDDANVAGERGVVSSVVLNGDSSYLDLAANMTGNYTTTNNAKAQLRSYFTPSSTPDVFTVVDLINAAEDYIDEQTQHGWRSKTVTQETHHRLRRKTSYLTGHPFNLYHRHITTFVSGTDKIEVWNGVDWVDWVATKTEGRGNDYWVDYNLGTVWLKGIWFWHGECAIRATYRFGESTVPQDIRDCAAMWVARELLSSEVSVNAIPSEAGQGVYLATDPRVRNYAAQIDAIIERHREVAFYND